MPASGKTALRAIRAEVRMPSSAVLLQALLHHRGPDAVHEPGRADLRAAQAASAGSVPMSAALCCAGSLRARCAARAIATRMGVST